MDIPPRKTTPSGAHCEQTKRREAKVCSEKENHCSAPKHLGAQEECILEALGKRGPQRSLVPQAPMGGLGKAPNGEAKTDGGGRGMNSPAERKEGPQGFVETEGALRPSPARAPCPLRGGRALREARRPSSRGPDPQYFGRWRA